MAVHTHVHEHAQLRVQVVGQSALCDLQHVIALSHEAAQIHLCVRRTALAWCCDVMLCGYYTVYNTHCKISLHRVALGFVHHQQAGRGGAANAVEPQCSSCQEQCSRKIFVRVLPKGATQRQSQLQA
jgi:hypothetical protein